MYAGRGCECPLPPARGSASGPTWEEIIIAQVLAHLDALPEDWGNYSPHWRCGYNQARNKVAALLKARTPNVVFDEQRLTGKPSGLPGGPRPGPTPYATDKR